MKYASFFLMLICMVAVSCTHAQQQPVKKEFRLPDVPDVLTAPEERAAYLSLHYWDHFDFGDTSLIARPDIGEQAFVDFISILPYSTQAQAAVDTLLSRALANKEMADFFLLLGDKYLYEPNSPMHNEDLYILFLQARVNSPALADVDKIRPRHLLEMALKNRPGDVAADFAFTCRNGKRSRLSGLKSDFILVYFNDPDCDDCRRVKAMLASSALLSEQLASGRLKILSVCVEGKTDAWKASSCPAGWIDSYDHGMRLTADRLYDLKAMPTLYLLDAEKRVVLKDTSVKQVEERLRGAAR